VLYSLSETHSTSLRVGHVDEFFTTFSAQAKTHAGGVSAKAGATYEAKKAADKTNVVDFIVICKLGKMIDLYAS